MAKVHLFENFKKMQTFRESSCIGRDVRVNVDASCKVAREVTHLRWDGMHLAWSRITTQNYSIERAFTWAVAEKSNG